MRTLFAALLFCAGLFGQGSVVQSVQQLGQTQNYALTFMWAGDPVTGAVPVTPANLPAGVQGYRILQVENSPGSPSPTSGYSVTFPDFFGGDLMLGALAS